MLELKHITDENFEELVIKSPIPAMIDFYTPLCGPCKALASKVQELANEYEGRAFIAKADAEACSNLSAQFRIVHVPTVLFFKNGKMVDRLVGLWDKDVYVEKLEALL